MPTPKEFDFKKRTKKFCLVGIFLVGFTTILGISPAIAMEKLGFDCEASFNISRIIQSFLAFCLPLLFFYSFKKINYSTYRLKNYLILFNLFELTFIQTSLTPYFTDPYTMCYAVDGQNGIEVVFAGIIALPILFLVSLLFSTLKEYYT